MAAMAIVGGTAAGARADDAVTARVPFAFRVGDTQMPAGVYTVSRKIEQPNAVTIAAATGELTSIVLGQRMAADASVAQPRLQFRRAGDTYYLTGVVLSYNDGTEVSIPVVTAAVPRSH